ncbi:MAG: hypothetical protein IH968_04910 [Gemmatimonadetes bacterium]|nr:hypothetical protein [Gemmatimonadota bacterium]
MTLYVVAVLAACAPLGTSAQNTGLITFDHYHTLAEIQDYLEAVTARHSELATLLEIGASRSGRPIWAVDINNPATGPAEEKPAFYVDGNIHGGEVLGGEGALAFIDRLLGAYGSDPRITELVDTRAFYVVPIVNPDGRAISVDTPENHRWNIRPVDEDGDGLVDEDPPEDLDGDGRMLQMRVPDPDGGWVIHPDDPRRMVRVRRNSEEGQRYSVYSEGIDNDGDGRFNEDRVGGVDLNRNFPANWSAAQFASGPFPLSEPETHALVTYITARPNIAAIHTFHTSGGLLLRFPTLADQDWEFPEADQEDYRLIAEDGVPITGYTNFAYTKESIVDLMSPGHGVFNDWGSKEFGVLSMTTEMWSHAFGEGQDALFRWNDEVLDGTGFIDWKPFDHPQLGPIEVGGWDRWSTSSPPGRLIAGELDRNVRWVLTFADKTPQVAILESMAERSGSDDRFRVLATVANIGWMATATVQATEVLEIAKPVRVSITLTNAELVEGEAVWSLGVLPGTHDGPAVERSLEWSVRVVDGRRPASAEITVWSEKAGTVRRVVRLGSPGQVPSDEVMPLYTTLGPYSRPITTASSEAQSYFTQGMQLMYSFRPEDARRSFKEAQARDPECAMCFWGEAWSLGPYLNGAMVPEDAPAAIAAIDKAKERSAAGSGIERMLIEAMAVRYVLDPDRETRVRLDTVYSRAMEKVWEAHPEDLEAGTLYGESLMLLEPRRGNWDIRRREIQRIHEVLEATLEIHIEHPGACHLYIHGTESTTRPDKAEACAAYLGNAIPGASHINHMPSHTWNRVGRWDDAVRANIQAWHTDQRAEYGEGFAIYPSHNLHMLLFSASMAGQGAVAIQAGNDYARLVPNGLFYRTLTLVRFGRFDEVLELGGRPNNGLFAGFWDFGRGYAHLRLGRPDSASVYLERVKRAAATLGDSIVFRGHPAENLLAVVGGILEAEIAVEDGRMQHAIEVLKRAVTVEDGLRYDEPEPLNFSARHWLGAVLLEAGRPAEAERVYRVALEDHPRNGWSLVGLEQSLRAQGRAGAADEVRAEFDAAWARADVWLRSSRF